MRLQPSVFPLHPQLFQIEAKREKEQLCPHVLPAARQKPAETKVRFQQSKRALYLDGSAQAQINASLRGNVLLRCFPQLLQRLVDAQFLRLLQHNAKGEVRKPFWAPDLVFFQRAILQRALSLAF